MEKEESFKNNLICWLFGHALPEPPSYFYELSKELRNGLLVRCERCGTLQPLVSFRSYKKIEQTVPENFLNSLDK